MRIILSPAKKMNVDVDSPIVPHLPLFLNETQTILGALKAMDSLALQQLWKCNDALTKLNVERLSAMELNRHLTPALFSYEGIQYRYMAPHVLESDQLDYLQTHLRIVSGFYGLLRPFDGVTPYRLEMQAKLPVDGAKHLYDFWGDKLAKTLTEESQCILNLASHEYSRGILPHVPQGVPVITCTFGERVNGAIKEKGTMCKMARGEMVRWLAEHRITNPTDIQAFSRLDYTFSPDDSTPNHYIFIKGDVSSC